ncbi:MAG: GT4 family glycosyltransferase PelF [Saccharofermentanales bacterium]
MKRKIKVMLATEGTYPHNEGGVSTWCDTLIKNLPEVDYLVYSVIMNPFIPQKFQLPQGCELISVPLWGTEEPFENLKTPFSQVYRTKNITTDEVIMTEFIPIFSEIVNEIAGIDKNPIRLGYLLLDMHNYFKKYDYRNTFKSKITWDTFTDIILSKANDKRNKLAQPPVFSMIQSLGWIYRFFSILCTPVPRVDITHSAAAAFCGIPCVLAKLIYNTPFILTEHGVYLREQYLSLSKRGYDSYLNTFFIRMINSIVKLNYAYADQISPVCSYNTRWETRFGVLPRKIKVIYNGVDKSIFYPRETPKKDSHLRVVTIARVDPVKDLITLIKAAVLIKEQVKDVSFHVYGSITVKEYYKECLAFVKEAGLEGSFIFEGNTNDTPAAYASGDVIVLSSITEAFPYSIVEAMMMGKPVVSTDVGGVSEALGDSGFLVIPRKHKDLADAVVTLLKDEKLRERLGMQGRERALKLFDVSGVLDSYYDSYIELTDRTREQTNEMDRMRKQKILAEKGYVMINMGNWLEGISQIRAAIKEYPKSLAVPLLLTIISDAYKRLGETEASENELARAEFLARISDEIKTA